MSPGDNVAFVIVRGVATGHYILLAAQAFVLALVIAHEVFMLRAVRAALGNETEVATEQSVLNVFIESQIPTVALFLLMAAPWLTPDQVLVAPAVLLYFLMIMLSTLRLSPVITLFTGVLSAGGYLSVMLYTGIRSQPGQFP